MYSLIETKKIKDKRGWFSELIRKRHLKKKTFGQLYLTVAKPGVTKGNHYHKRKYDYFFVVKGYALLTLEKLDKKSLKVIKKVKIKLSKRKLQVVEIHPWVNHYIKNTGKRDMWLLGYISEEYDSSDPDTFIL
jgi:UDP-2-acetamido-2,6-beta-L-arabino-hexul-4-ose reductase